MEARGARIGEYRAANPDCDLPPATAEIITEQAHRTFGINTGRSAIRPVAVKAYRTFAEPKLGQRIEPVFAGAGPAGYQIDLR